MAALVFTVAHGLSLVLPSCAELCRVVPRGLLISVTSLGAEHGLKGVYTSAVASHELSSCSPWAVDHRLGRCGTQA